MNSDEYDFTAFCPICKEKRGVAASKKQIKEGGQVSVYAIHCDHSWKLSQEDSDKLRKNSTGFGEI
jgi:C4-type Zn-finger protein